MTISVKQGRSGNWAVYQSGDDYPVSAWFSTKSAATTEMKRMGGCTPKTAKVKPEEPSIFGYAWEDIQAMQQGTYKRPTIKLA